MDISQEWNKDTNITGTNYNQPKIRLTHIKRIKINKQIKETISRTHVNHIKQRRSSWKEHSPCLGSRV